MGSDLLWLPVITFLIYCPILSYLDWKYRDVKTHWIWAPLIAVNVPVLLAAYSIGQYPLPLAAISAVSVVLWFAMMRLHFLNGADFVWLSLISVFLVENPISGNPFMEGFFLYLVIMTAATFWFIWLDNITRRISKIECRKMDMGTFLNVPYLIPISCAVVLAVVMG